MFTPSEISRNYADVARAKTGNVWYKTLILAVLAGTFIAFGAVLSVFASADFSGSAASLIKGAVFPLGLILVVICGAELFTGNCLLIAPAINREIRLRPMFKSLGIAYAGNLIGGVLIAVLVVYSHAMSGNVAVSCISTAAAKCNLDFWDAFVRGILCNILVCLAVWAAMASKTVTGKILAMYLPVFAFVACGFEHSVADMYYLTAGLIAGAEYGITVAGLTFGNAVLCLLAATLGNIIGGGLIAVAYNTVYGRRKSAHVTERAVVSHAQAAETAACDETADDNQSKE